MIVGFPTETEEEFTELCEDLVKLDLDHVGVFSFSKEEGTKAAEMDGHLHPSIKRRRKNTLIKILQDQRNEKLSALIGQQVEVMIEGAAEESELLIQSRMPSQAQEIDGRVLINDLGDNEEIQLVPGDFALVEITELAQQDLVGRLIKVTKPMIRAQQGLTTAIAKGVEHRHDQRAENI
jgi:ribosomal protein S12 methylthiotransferase